MTAAGWSAAACGWPRARSRSRSCAGRPAGRTRLGCARARRRRAGGRAVPADVDRGRARRCLAAERRLARSSRLYALAEGRAREADAILVLQGHGHRHPAWPGHAGAHRPRRRRDRAVVIAAACSRPNSGGWRACAFPWCRCRTRPPGHTALSRARPRASAAHAARPRPARLLPLDGGGLVIGGYERLAPAFLDGDGFDRIRRTSTDASWRTTGTASRRSW